MRRKPFNSKRCPRCGTKNDYTQTRCIQCGLIFSRVENASNALAKDLIMSGQKNLTIKAPGYPKDVSKKKFMLLCCFLGFFGAHNFYVGRMAKAIFQLVVGLFSIVMTALSGVPALDFIMTFAFLPVAVNAFMWFFDIFDGAINRYRIPVAVDFTDGKTIQEKPKKEKKAKKQAKEKNVQPTVDQKNQENEEKIQESNIEEESIDLEQKSE